ncbi:MAG: hypothetical protein KDA96_11325 [Planctomycetaceae bacterium]|nr:hypothetical protein [Planctomycetaceae bacterium]
MSEQLFGLVRKLIRNSTESRYAMSKATGISESQLTQFMSGTKGLGNQAVDSLLSHLGYEIRVVKKRRIR